MISNRAVAARIWAQSSTRRNWVNRPYTARATFVAELPKFARNGVGGRPSRQFAYSICRPGCGVATSRFNVAGPAEADDFAGFIAGADVDAGLVVPGAFVRANRIPSPLVHSAA
jgi:hypothetical protein